MGQAGAPIGAPACSDSSNTQALTTGPALPVAVRAAVVRLLAISRLAGPLPRTPRRFRRSRPLLGARFLAVRSRVRLLVPGCLALRLGILLLAWRAPSLGRGLGRDRPLGVLGSSLRRLWIRGDRCALRGRRWRIETPVVLLPGTSLRWHALRRVLRRRRRTLYLLRLIVPAHLGVAGSIAVIFALQRSLLLDSGISITGVLPLIEG